MLGEYIGNNMAYIKAIEALKEEYNCIEDYYQEIFKYQTGFAYPLFIHIKNKKCIQYEEMINLKYMSILNSLK